MQISVAVVCAVDPVLADTAAAVLGCDLPDLLAVRYQVLPAGGGLRRVSSTSRALLETVELAVPGCPTCAVRDDLLALLALLERLRDGATRQLVVELPVSMDPVAICFGLQEDPDGPAVLSASMAVLDAATLHEDLLGDDLLAERALAFGEHDRRSVGEALARQIETADLIAICGRPTDRERALLDHVVGVIPVRTELHSLDADALFARRRGHELARLGDLRLSAATGAPDAAGVWTLDLASWRPMHPQRLQDRLETLGSGPVRGRGWFWLPTRPDLQCAWDGAGGQLSIGELDRWDGAPNTRLVLTGVDHDPEPLRRAFAESLLTDAELAAGLDSWRDRDDGLDLWLGPREDHCGSAFDLLAEDD